jgi:bromodomain and WD repeat domain-containing protein 1/3
LQNTFGRRNGRSNGELSKPWQESCKELLDKLWQSRDSEPFRKAVDPTEYQDYARQIDTPMDLMSVKEDLLGGNYSNPQEFARDMRLIFSNSKAYNTDKHSQVSLFLKLNGNLLDRTQSLLQFCFIYRFIS